MRYLIDTDILIKIAHCNLLGQIAPALNTKEKDLFYTVEIITKISPLKEQGVINPLYKEYGASLLRLEPFLKKCSRLDNKSNKESLGLISRLKKLDQSTKNKNNGEIWLSVICLTEKNEESLIITGDKEYIQLLVNANDSYSDIKDGLQNRFITFELLILKMLQLHKDKHMDFVKQLKDNDYGKDKNLKIIFRELGNRCAYYDAVFDALKGQLKGFERFLIPLV